MVKISKLFKSIDIYGYQVGVNFKGDRTYNTYFGSILTLVTTIAILNYGYG